MQPRKHEKCQSWYFTSSHCSSTFLPPSEGPRPSSLSALPATKYPPRFMHHLPSKSPSLRIATSSQLLMKRYLTQIIHKKIWMVDSVKNAFSWALGVERDSLCQCASYWHWIQRFVYYGAVLCDAELLASLTPVSKVPAVPPSWRLLKKLSPRISKVPLHLHISILSKTPTSHSWTSWSLALNLKSILHPVARIIL